VVLKNPYSYDIYRKHHSLQDAGGVGFRSVVAKDTTMSVVVKLARETEEQAPDDVRFVNRYAAKFNVVNWPIRCDQSEGTPCHGGANI